MTYKQFLAALSQTPRDWYLDNGWFIRRHKRITDPLLCSDNQCPITSLANRPTDEYLEVAESLLLDPTLAGKIARAADRACHHGRGIGWDAVVEKDIRRDLLVACGLKEEN